MSDTEISDALRASLSYRVAASVTRSLDAAVRGIHQRSRREGRGSLAAVQASRSFRSLAACVSGIHRLQGIMRAAGARSALFGGGTGRVLPLARALAKLDRWLVLIPFNFLFLDYAIRDLGPLQAFSNIWDEAVLLCLAVYVVLRPLWLETSYRLRWGDLDWLVVLFIGLGVGLLGFVSPEP
ncbi:MAG TPA: hypothetical protein VFD74_07705, partial [Thermoleophilia bacterium]|nr:hypothetical protein [Thermoleophilia bacterium]